MKLHEITMPPLQGASDIETPLARRGGTEATAIPREQILAAIESQDDEARINMLRLLATNDLRLYGVNTHDRRFFERLWKQNQTGGPFTNRQRRDLKEKLKEHVDAIAELAAQKGVDVFAKAGAPAQRGHTEDNIGLPDERWLARQQDHVQQLAQFIKDLPANVSNKEAANVAMQSLPGQTGKFSKETAENQIRMIRARIDHEKKEQIRSLQRGFGEPRVGPWDWQAT